jgi:hypothetical protein
MPGEFLLSLREAREAEAPSAEAVIRVWRVSTR